MTLEVKIRHRFPGFSLDVAFTTPTPGVTALFGPSGCGKTTILTTIAGLLHPDHAVIHLDGTILADAARWVPPERRQFGVVFQDARLFPHLSVANNLRYGLRRAPPGIITLATVVELLDLAPLMDRRPRFLSGGERSRVAIGRALLAQPRLLLMDEPLSALDAEHRAEILPYLAALKQQLGLPIVYVTHAFEEVALLADTLVMLEKGRILAQGPIDQVVTRPDLALARRPNAASVLLATVQDHIPAQHLSRVAAAGQIFLVPLLDAPPGAALRLRINANDVAVATACPEAISFQNILSTTIGSITPNPARPEILLQLHLPGGRLLARVTQDTVARLDLTPGRPVWALLKSVAIEVLRA